MNLEYRNLFTGSFEEDCRNEWLETNGLGGFACGTVSGCPTRKYHGLFSAPAKGKEGRFLFLHALETAVIQPGNGTEVGLNVNKYPGSIHPGGYQFIESFSPFPFPRWTSRIGNIVLSREIIMPRERKEVILRLTVMESGEKVPVKVVPYFSFRDIHTLTFENSGISTQPAIHKKSIVISPYDGLPPLYLDCSSGAGWKSAFFWDRNIEYEIEENRGFDFREDRFCSGWWTMELSEGESVCFRASLIPPEGNIEAHTAEEEKRRKTSFSRYKEEKKFLGWLKYTGEHFLLKNDRGEPSINAGYPWFGEWGRDTMISLPGLTFLSGRKELGGEILKSYAEYIKDGLLPNTLGGLQGFYSYNSIDAGLLYFRAVQEMERWGGDEKSVKKHLYPVLSSLLQPYLENRVPHTRLEEDGLLSAGTEDTQLTWMDATAWGKPVTSRHGKAVEINGLWYNALCFFRELSRKYGTEIPDSIDSLIEQIPVSFRSAFWLQEKRYCADCVRQDIQDSSIRPNMLFAAAVPHSPLTKTEADGIIATAEEHLLTPFGLRTLSPGDPGFQRVYEGNGNLRDSRYHQGTVWPWLFGVYVEACLKWAEDPGTKAEELAVLLESFLEKHLFRDGLGLISEIFDGLEPGMGKGGIGMAWSSGEIIRAFALLDKVRK